MAVEVPCDQYIKPGMSLTIGSINDLHHKLKTSLKYCHISLGYIY
jgi:hypothetical protein